MTKILKKIKILKVNEKSIVIQTRWNKTCTLPKSKVIGGRKVSNDFTETIVIPDWLYYDRELSPLKSKTYITKFKTI